MPRDTRPIMEKQVVLTMISLYCTKHHQKQRGNLCPACEQLVAYAHDRIEHCPQEGHKPFCSRCQIHCYQSDLRERIRTVMCYSGPRMLLYHPVVAIRHRISSVKRHK